MTKHIVTNMQCCHLWANQSQDWARGASISFNGAFLSSYRQPIGRFTDTYLNGKRVVLVDNGQKWSVTTAKHINYANRALHGHDHLEIMHVHLVQSRIWGERDQIPHTVNIMELYKAYQARCERICNPRIYFYHGLSDTLYFRQKALFEAATPYREYCQAFGVEEPYPNFDYWLAKLNGAWARYYDPNQVSARDARDAKKRMREFHVMSHIHAWLEGIYAYALTKKDDEYLVQHAAKGLPRRLRRDAESLIRSRINPYRPAVTPEQWINGEGSAHQYYAWQHGYAPLDKTLVRRKGDTLETSQGASVPWQDALRTWRLIQDVKCRGKEYRPNGLRFGVGGFTVEHISPEGNMKIGCHNLAFDEMMRLAMREAPESVKACYPLPMIVGDVHEYVNRDHD